jgi:hypothetical protein
MTENPVTVSSPTARPGALVPVLIDLMLPLSAFALPWMIAGIVVLLIARAGLFA